MVKFDAMQENFEEITVLGRPALFTDVRIELDTVLDGLYAEWVPYMKAYRLYDACHPQQTVAYEKDTVVAEQRAELEKALECEQEWRPYEDTDNVRQADYKRLADQSDTEHMSDEKAKDLLYEWYGFASEKITIHHSVPVYEVNRHGRLRKVGEMDRSPLYNATDWNYIRFDCGRMSYELHDGDLRLYMY